MACIIFCIVSAHLHDFRVSAYRFYVEKRSLRSRLHGKCWKLPLSTNTDLSAVQQFDRPLAESFWNASGRRIPALMVLSRSFQAPSFLLATKTPPEWHVDLRTRLNIATSLFGNTYYSLLACTLSQLPLDYSCWAIVRFFSDGQGASTGQVFSCRRALLPPLTTTAFRGCRGWVVFFITGCLRSGWAARKRKWQRGIP